MTAVKGSGALLIEDSGIAEVKVVHQIRRGDDRGWFSRAWCQEELAAAGLDAGMSQVNFSSTSRAGTVRGLHLQRPPRTESKLVYVLRGAVVDVAVDMREGSPTRHQHVMRELSAENGQGLYIPKGFAHGFQTLTEDVLMVYAISAPYSPQHEEGFAHDDPQLGIDWPLPVTVISPKDAGHQRLPSPPWSTDVQ